MSVVGPVCRPDWVHEPPSSPTGPACLNWWLLQSVWDLCCVQQKSESSQNGCCFPLGLQPCCMQWLSQLDYTSCCCSGAAQHAALAPACLKPVLNAVPDSAGPRLTGAAAESGMLGEQKKSVDLIQHMGWPCTRGTPCVLCGSDYIKGQHWEPDGGAPWAASGPQAV